MSSFGIACFRHITGNGYEVALVRRRYTYEFRIFAYGDYKMYKPPRMGPDLNALSALLSKMTVDEKLLILTWDFDRIWYKIWLSNTLPPDIQREKFSRLINTVGKETLTCLINNSNSVDPIWELPKGRKDLLESDIECAVRELGEETGIKRNMYIIHLNEYIRVNLRDMGSNYTMKYWSALMNNSDKEIVPKIGASTDINALDGLGSCHEHDSVKFIQMKYLVNYVPTYLVNPIKTLCMRLRKKMRGQRVNDYDKNKYGCPSF